MTHILLPTHLSHKGIRLPPGIYPSLVSKGCFLSSGTQVEGGAILLDCEGKKERVRENMLHCTLVLKASHLSDYNKSHGPI